MPQLQIRQPGAAGIVTGAAAQADSAPSYTDHGGPLLDHAQVQLVFWGSVWAASPTPSAADVSSALRTLLTSSYMSGLAQYRGITGASLRGTLLATHSDPPSPFSDNQVADFLRGLMEAGSLPEPDDANQLVYCVVLPTGVRFQDQTVIGQHSYFWYWDVELPLDADLAKAHYAWVTNDGTLGTVTTILSHELVEMVTDPEGSAVTGSHCDSSGWCEIGDACEGNSGVVDGVTVQAYWSQQAGSCVVPGAS